MLGYRHAFHAGNHADILKHLVLFHCLRYMTQKPKPLLYLDTHAGAGSYRLSEGYAALNREWETGLGRLAGEELRGTMPESVRDYLLAVEVYGKDHPGEFPGSPAIAASVLRPCDRLVLREIHPADFEYLNARFASDGRAQVLKEDGFGAIKAVLPPVSRRGLVMVDPPYEIVSEYDSVVEALAGAVNRFETGTYLIWYPLLERPEAQALPSRLLGLTVRPCLRAELRIRNLDPGDRGLPGSGMIIINPPWFLESALRSALPFLAGTLGRDASACWSLASHS